MEVRFSAGALNSHANLVGGYSSGQIYDELYTPDQLVKDSVSSGTPVIYVAMNYRLGSEHLYLASRPEYC
jgi:hypothetical protein